MVRRNVPKYRENPFLEHTAEISVSGYKKIFSKQNKDMCLVINPQDGDIKPAGFYFRHEVEQNEFVKLYAEGVAALMGLKSPGKKVFQIVYNQLFGKEGKDRTEIVLNYELLSDDEKKGISKRTFINGINELIQNKFIAESVVASFYFINTAYIYNGNRLAVVKEYIIKKHKKFTERTLEEMGQQALPLDEVK
jgi:hypothetical protein